MIDNKIMRRTNKEFLNEVVHESTGFSPVELEFDLEKLKLLPRGRLHPESNEKFSHNEKLTLADAPGSLKPSAALSPIPVALTCVSNLAN
ncbi:hypothetical protein JTB14_017900 [Gonioctena quinquepunctata]|nr:hypothetical protein JTB14_017900 [Gonioctena quinquepunctata]